MNYNELKEAQKHFDTDNLFQRLTKSKEKYIKEGKIICGRYYGKILKETKNDIKQEKIELENKLNQQDIEIKKLKDIVKMYKEKDADSETCKNGTGYSQNESSHMDLDSEMLVLVNMLEYVQHEDEKIIQACDDLCNDIVINREKMIGGE